MKSRATEPGTLQQKQPTKPAVERPDIVTHERIVSAIDAQRQLFQLVVEHAPAGIAIYDGRTFRLKWANPTYKARLDEPHRSMDITGLRLDDIFPGVEKSGVKDIFREVAQTRRPHFDPEQELAGLERGTTYWHWSLLPLARTEQETPDLMILVIEVTEQVLARKRIEELAAQLAEERKALAATNLALELRNREIEKATRLKSEFLASMSHELRTPLHSIIGFSELLAEQMSSSARQERQITHVLRSSRHLLSLINDILDLSKIEAGRLELQRESCMAQGIVGEVLATIEPIAAEKQIHIENQLDPDLVVWADRLRLKQILYNLLSNAVKFTSPGGSVSIRCTRSETAVEMTVSDTGIGIPAAEQDEIFNEFRQSRNSATGSPEGTGLGLAITKRLIECHGGRIWLCSKPGAGSSFTFSLPFHSASGMEDLRDAAQSRGEEQALIGSQETSSARVLIVDDSAEGREFLREALAPRGYEVIESANGLDSIDKIRDFHPGLVVLDIQMPGMTGYEVVQWIRKQEEFRSLPVVALTAFAMQGDQEKALRAGFDLYLSKPISPKSLRSELKNLLKRKDSDCALR